MADKLTLKQRIEKHEKDAEYLEAKAAEFSRRAKDKRERAEKMRREAAEANS
jgi:hypothetical protein